MAQQTVIENPILNSPFVEPTRHFRFTETGITNDIVESRRVSSYFIPIPRPKKRGGKLEQQLTFETEWTQDRVEENKFINQIRSRVTRWRQLGRPGITRTTARLLEHWQRPERERGLFFCQIEALETAIYLTEAASKQADLWIENDLRKFNEDANPGLFRIALKMATGSGKTVVMGMLIAWQTLNKLANKQDKRFSDAFLIVAPGITIRDRLRVLLPNDQENYYRFLDLVPADLFDQLGQAKIVITNFHSLKLRERIQTTKLTKSILRGEANSPFTETGSQMVARVCRELGNKRNIIVLNDEAHHCYRLKPDVADELELKGDEKKEAETRNEDARLWITGLEDVQKKLGIRAIYDLSATPFFLRGSGYTEGNLFPWVVSDFSLIDAIESGIVKVPRVPVADDSMTGEQPTYRDLWIRIKDDLPKKGRKTDSVAGIEPKLPATLEAALQSLYANYEKSYKLWQSQTSQHNPTAPPVFIVVCNNTNVSKLVFDWVSGWEKTLPDGSTVWVPGKLDIFSNVQDGQTLHKPNTILVDSEQLESGDAMSAEFKKMAAVEIEEFKKEYRARFPGRDADSLTDEDLLREVLNTVGKLDKLGGNVKCVVSVSMLTEGWDANTVTHILGVRAFGTQLLCEQVVGRGLRRMSYQPDSRGFFEPEYAEVYGVPFSFIPCSGSGAAPTTHKQMTRVRALEDRQASEIRFPRVVGYRYDFPAEKLTPKFTEQSKHVLNTKEFATKTELRTIIGQAETHTLEGLQGRRLQEVVFLLAKLTLEVHLKDDQGNDRPWLFPSLLRITNEWMKTYLHCQDNTFPQLLLVEGKAREAAEKIARAVVAGAEGEKTLKPILRPYDSEGTTRHVDFNTSRPVYETRPDLVSRTDSTGTTSFDYEAGGQLLSLAKPSSQVVSYDLDAGNKRAAKRVNGTVQRKWLFAGGLLPVAEFDANDNLTSVFHGSYMVKNGTTYRLLRDHLGSVRIVVDSATGTVAQRLSYGPWGEVLEDTNPGFQPFGFAGGLYDPDTGLVRFGARDYDPSVGRWTCRDPIGLVAGTNAYAYANNSPTNYVDASGLIYTVNNMTGNPNAGAFVESMWEQATGYDVEVSPSGLVSIPDRSAVNFSGTSGNARQLLRQMIDSSSTFQLDLIEGQPPFCGSPGILSGFPKNRHAIDVRDIQALYNYDDVAGLGAFVHENAEGYAISKSNSPSYPTGHAEGLRQENLFYGDIAPNYHRSGNDRFLNDPSGKPYGAVIDYGLYTLRASFAPISHGVQGAPTFTGR